MTFLKNAWYVAAHSHELDMGLVARTICNEPIVMFRTEAGDVAALQDRCPHRFVPLSMGKQVGDSVQCGYHGLRFGKDGSCVEAPNDEEAQRLRMCVRSYAAVERYTFLWMWLGDPAMADPDMIPNFDFFVDDRFTCARGYTYIKGNYQLLSDNLLDLSHIHYLHPEVHKGSDFANFTNKVKIEGETIWSMLWRHHYHIDARRQAMWNISSDDVEGQGHARWNMPANLFVDTAFWEHGKTFDDAFRTPNAHLLTPETEFSTHYFWGSGRNFLLDNQDLTDASVRSTSNIFETQDGPMIEAQQAAMGQSDKFVEMNPCILRADAAGLAARRILKRRITAEALGEASDVGEEMASVAAE